MQRLSSGLSEIDASISKYESTVERIKAIEDILVAEEERKNSRWWNIDPNVLIQCGVSIGTALLVMNYEKTDVIISKAWGLVNTPKKR